MTELEIGSAGVAIAARSADAIEKRYLETISGRSAGQEKGARETGAREGMTESSTSITGTLTLRVAEARVEDVGHAIARLAPADLRRIGARTGDVLKITGGTVAVGRAEFSDDGHEGMIQIDGTCRSNCGAGLQEQVTVSVIERQDAVAVRFSPLWIGAAPATIAPDRMLEDLVGVPVSAPTSASSKAIKPRRALRQFLTKISAASSAKWLVSAKSSNCP